MKYIFRGLIIFEYDPKSKIVREHSPNERNGLCVFNFCSLIPEDYKLLSEFFDKSYRHTYGEEVDLSDIIVN